MLRSSIRTNSSSMNTCIICMHFRMHFLPPIFSEPTLAWRYISLASNVLDEQNSGFSDFSRPDREVLETHYGHYFSMQIAILMEVWVCSMSPPSTPIESSHHLNHHLLFGLPPCLSFTFLPFFVAFKSVVTSI